MSAFDERAFREDGGHWFRKGHTCEECDEFWQDEWSCLCNDDCPSCGAEIEPDDDDVEDLSQHWREELGWGKPYRVHVGYQTKAGNEAHAVYDLRAADEDEAMDIASEMVAERADFLKEDCATAAELVQ